MGLIQSARWQEYVITLDMNPSFQPMVSVELSEAIKESAIPGKHVVDKV